MARGEVIGDLNWVDTKKLNAYYAELGAFVEVFALYEVALFEYLQAIAGIPPHAAKILCSGANLESRLGNIRRFWAITPPSSAVKKELDGVFNQVAHIAKVRNSLLHYGADMVGDEEHITSDESRALSEDLIVAHRVNKQVLGQMRLDMVKARGHLESLTDSPGASFAERAQADEFLARAWRYKHAPMKNQKSRKPTQYRRTPP